MNESNTSVNIEEYSISVLDLIFSGGAINIIIITILFILLGVSVYIYLDRVFVLKNINDTDDSFVNSVKDLLIQGNIKKAHSICRSVNTPVSRLISKVVDKHYATYSEKLKAIENAAVIEIHYLEKNVYFLGTISNVAPMIGFLGTVIGMIIAFHSLASSGGQADMEILADGLYTAMSTTVAGLIVGITSSIGYNHIVNRCESTLSDIQVAVMDFVDSI